MTVATAGGNSARTHACSQGDMLLTHAAACLGQPMALPETMATARTSLTFSSSPRPLGISNGHCRHSDARRESCERLACRSFVGDIPESLGLAAQPQSEGVAIAAAPARDGGPGGGQVLVNDSCSDRSRALPRASEDSGKARVRVGMLAGDACLHQREKSAVGSPNAGGRQSKQSKLK